MASFCLPLVEGRFERGDLSRDGKRRIEDTESGLIESVDVVLTVPHEFQTLDGLLLHVEFATRQQDSTVVRGGREDFPHVAARIETGLASELVELRQLLLRHQLL